MYTVYGVTERLRSSDLPLRGGHSIQLSYSDILTPAGFEPATYSVRRLSAYRPLPTLSTRTKGLEPSHGRNARSSGQLSYEVMEQDTGVEPAYSAWKADVLTSAQILH